jgi:hypothetical protein
MKYLMMFGFLVASSTLCLAQDIEEKVDGTSDVLVLADAGMQPLYVVSAMKTAKIISKDEFDKLNQSQIDYIQVINDPSSTTIYGEKARNGVVLVVMKGTSISEKFSGRKKRQR